MDHDRVQALCSRIDTVLHSIRVLLEVDGPNSPAIEASFDLLNELVHELLDRVKEWAHE